MAVPPVFPFIVCLFGEEETMKILVLGDVVSQPGLNTIRRLLRNVKKKTGADLTIVNG